MRILVTGGAGFIGSILSKNLLRQSIKFQVLDNFSTGKRENILPFSGKIELIEGDIRSYHIVREAVDSIDFVIHQAALPSVTRSIRDPITTNAVNVGGTLNILNAAHDAKVKRVIYASSSSIYGDSEVLPKKENMMPNPLSPYAVSKSAGEKYCQIFLQIYGLEAICLRYFNVFGPRQDPTSQYSAVIPKFIRMLMRNESPIIYGDGEQSRDFTYVSNVVDANILACTTANAIGEVINIACGERITLNNLAKALKNITGKNIEFKYSKERIGDVKHSQADIEKARKLLDYKPKIKVLEGLKRTVESYKNL